MISKKKQIIIVGISILFSILFNIILFNIDVLAEYFTNKSFDTFTQPHIARYVCYLLFASFFNKSEINKGKLFLIILLPVFLIDSTTLFLGPDLFPHRFPYATLYPALGIYCGLNLRQGKIKVVFNFFISILFIIVSQLYTIPYLLRFMHYIHDISQNTNTTLTNNFFLGIDKKTVNLFDTLNGSKAALIEFYFVGCAPCEQKFTYLKNISNKYKTHDFSFVLICDGTANTYKQFLTHSEQNKDSSIIFLYDSNNTIPKYKIDGYPTELLVDSEKNIIKKEKGFGIYLADDWLKREIFILDKILLNEK